MESQEALIKFLENINSNLYKIINADKLMEILNKNLRLSSIDIINRIIISVTYNDKIYDIRTSKEWELLNRRVIDRTKSIKILVPVETSQYIDTETKETIDTNEFNSFEIEKALEYGIIQRIKSVIDFSITEVYDIKNTTGLSNSSYQIDKVKSGLDSIVKAFKKITNANVERLDNTTYTISNNSYYSKSDNTLFIPKIDYNSLILQISNILFDIITNNNLKEYIRKYPAYTANKFSESEFELLRQSTIYSIASLFDGYNIVKFNEAFNINKNIAIEDLIELLAISDSISYEVIQNTEDLNGNKIDDVANNALIIEKAEKLINIATASILYDKILK